MVSTMGTRTGSTKQGISKELKDQNICGFNRKYVR
jgi:hypothetical protein